jgi:hypothetical protein
MTKGSLGFVEEYCGFSEDTRADAFRHCLLMGSALSFLPAPVQCQLLLRSRQPNPGGANGQKWTVSTADQGSENPRFAISIISDRRKAILTLRVVALRLCTCRCRQPYETRSAACRSAVPGHFLSHRALQSRNFLHDAHTAPATRIP